MIRESEGPPRFVENARLALLVKILNDAERSIGVLERRGIVFKEFVENYFDGQRLPVYHIRFQGQSEFFYEKEEYEKRQAELDTADEVQETEKSQESAIEVYLAEELHEVVRLNEIHLHLQKEFNLGIRDFQQQSVRPETGEETAGRFEIISGTETISLGTLDQAGPAIRQIGSKGMDIKCFKGLGEMNSDQLWSTTMDPQGRTLLKVQIEDAGEADRLFSILMGDDVEKRRKFIQEHALEVQNLDV